MLKRLSSVLKNLNKVYLDYLFLLLHLDLRDLLDFQMVFLCLWNCNWYVVISKTYIFSCVCHCIISGKTEFSPDEDAHVVSDCVKVLFSLLYPESRETFFSPFHVHMWIQLIRTSLHIFSIFSVSCHHHQCLLLVAQHCQRLSVSNICSLPLLLLHLLHVET